MITLILCVTLATVGGAHLGYWFGRTVERDRWNSRRQQDLQDIQRAAEAHWQQLGGALRSVEKGRN